MSLTRVPVAVVRNLYPVTLSPSPRINILYGDNGNGKISVLEATHLLGLARSLRSARLQPVTQYEEVACTVFGQVILTNDTVSNLGISRERQGEFTTRIDGQNARSMAQLAETLPLQLVNPDSLQLLEGAPKTRRQFLDWEVLHAELRFLPVWQRLQKALRQRNPQLRHGKLDPVPQAVWGWELSLVNDEIDTCRRSYIQALKPIFEETLTELVPLDDLTLSYYRDRDKDRDLLEVLASSLLRDQQVGHTQAGPQHADLRIWSTGHNATEILSHGQQKLVVCALRIAQGHLVNRAKRGQCVYLVDDLPSELGEQYRMAPYRLLEDLGCQVFIICVGPQLLKGGWRTDTPVSMFHMEYGKISQTTTIGNEA